LPRAEPRLVSVVMPLLNAAGTVESQLDALAAQDYGGEWALVVADNGSSDGSKELVERRLERLPSARLIDAAARRGPGHARNAGAAAAGGELLAFCDADDAACPGWLSGMVAAARGADLVAGRLDIGPLNDELARSWHVPPPADSPMTPHGFLPMASGSSCAVWSDVFEQIGGFDEELANGGDMDFSWRAQLAGYTLGFAPDAVMRRRLPSRARLAARQHYRWGRATPPLYRAFRDAGMGRRTLRTVGKVWADLSLTLPLVPFSARARGRWLRIAALHVGHVVGSVRHRVLFL